jgi:hypothetical protein
MHQQQPVVAVTPAEEAEAAANWNKNRYNLGAEIELQTQVV